MTYSALAWYMGTVLFGGQKETSGSRYYRGDDEISLTRARRVPRRQVSNDPAMIEDDYFRFRHAPRD